MLSEGESDEGPPLNLLEPENTSTTPTSMPEETDTVSLDPANPPVHEPEPILILQHSHHLVHLSSTAIGSQQSLQRKHNA